MPATNLTEYLSHDIFSYAYWFSFITNIILLWAKKKTKCFSQTLAEQYNCVHTKIAFQRYEMIIHLKYFTLRRIEMFNG